MKLALKWKLLPLAAVAALGFFALIPGGGAKPEPAEAVIDCGTTWDLTIEIVDNSQSGDLITVAGATVRVSPDPQDNAGTRLYTDNATNDDSATTGRILESDACSASTGTDYTVSLESLPASLDCDIVDDVVVTGLTANTTVELQVTNCVVLTPTPGTTTPTPTGTPGTATPTVTTTPTGDVVTIVAVPTNPPCGSPSFIFATVRNAAGAPLNGQTVVFTATGAVGTFNPASGMTGVDGVASTTYTPPATGTQSITVTATANGKSASTVITTSCTTVAATNTPVPATPISQVKPPSTGDAGLVGGGDSPLYAGLALLIGLTFTGGLVLARRRA